MLLQIVFEIVDLCDFWDDICQLHLTSKQVTVVIASAHTILPGLEEIVNNRFYALPKLVASTNLIVGFTGDAIIEPLFIDLDEYKSDASFNIMRVLFLSIKKSKRLIQMINESGLKLSIRSLPSQFQYLDFAKNRDGTGQIKLIAGVPILLASLQPKRQQHLGEYEGVYHLMLLH